MKKALRGALLCVLALAMLLTSFTFVLAEGEAADTENRYDFGDAYAVNDTFTGIPATDYPNATMPAAITAEDYTGPWQVGYYSYTSNFNTFSPFTILHRYGVAFRSPQDLTDETKPTSMIWTNNAPTYANPASTYWNAAGTAQIAGDGGYMIADPNLNIGSVGYNFGSGRSDGSSATGWNFYGAIINHKAIRFKAPRAGVIIPELKLAARDADRVIYRLDKIDADGTRTRVYPLSTETTVNFSTFAAGTTAPEEWVAGWGVLPAVATGFLTQNQGVVRVAEGDVLELRFAAHNAGSTPFQIDTVIMHYSKEFGPDDGLFLASPMAEYDKEITYITKDVTTIDLSRPLLNPIAQGKVEYTLTGNTAVLREIAPMGTGQYALTGVLNAGGEPAVVTAYYYSPGKCSANGDEWRFKTSTNIYVNAASTLVEPFRYDIFTTSDNGYAYDSFLLPYYSDATEAAIYGTIDLGIADAWKNATVTFDQAGYFEYLGNGRIRALAKYDFVTSGGVEGGNDGTTALPLKGSTAVPSARDTVSLGTPVVMTITAPDGGVKQFGLWSFATTVQAAAADKNVYTLDPSVNTISNAVISVEAYTADGTFVPTYKDASHNSTAFTPIADYKFGNVVFAPRMTSEGDISIPLNQETYWNVYQGTEAWHKTIGIAQTFTAPRDGTIDLNGYWPTDGYWYNDNVATAMSKGTYINYAVKLYDVDGKVLSTLWAGDYGVTAATDTSYKLIATRVDSDFATQANDEAKTLTVSVKKGQKIRVMVDTVISDGGSYITLSKSNGYAPAPVFTYTYDNVSFGDESFTVTDNKATAKVYVPGYSTIEDALVIAYDANGNIVGTSTVATNDKQIVDADGTYGVVLVDVPTTAASAYMKLFFWDGLDNIQPLYGDITIH